MPFVIDTNLYVHAERDPGVRATLRGFLRDVSDRVVVSTMVLHELFVGATDTKSRVGRAPVLRSALMPIT